MNKAFMVITVGAALCISAAAQTHKTGPDSAPAPGKTKAEKQDHKRSASKSSETALAAGTALETQLQGVVDVRRGAVGDQVVLKTTRAVKQNGEVIVQKGSLVLGRITEVQRRSKDNAVSRVGMVFDRIQGKSFEAPVHLSLVSVVNTVASAGTGDAFGTDISSSGSSTATASSSGSSGGLLGSVAPAVGGIVSGTTRSVGNAVGGTTQTLGQATIPVGNTVGGLTVSQSAGGAASLSSAVSAVGNDVRIEKGATFNLVVTGSVVN